MSRLIKRYANRKLYDTSASRYVTLDSVTELVRGGEDLRIIDNDTGEDLTALMFAQIILEEEKRKRGLLDLPVLRWIIQQGGATFQEILHGVERGRDAIDGVRELAEDRVQRVRDLMVGESPRPVEPEGDPGGSTAGKGLLTDLLELPQRQLEQLQRRIDQQIRSSVEAISNNPTLRKELGRLEQSMQRIERRLAGTPRPGPKQQGGTGKKKRRGPS